MRICIYFTLVLVIGSICFAEIPPAKILEQILEEQSESIYNFQGKFALDATVLYDLNREQKELFLDFYDRQYEIATEKGKMYSLASSVDPIRPHDIFKQSWNGEVGYSSSETPENALNGVNSKFELGAHAEVMMFLEQTGLMSNKIFGTYDIKAGSQIAKVYSPLMVFERIRKTGSETENIFFEEIEYNGKPHLKMSLVIDKGSMASLMKNPLAEHIMDPGLDYACVESKLYNTEGLLNTIVRDYGLDKNGELLLKECTITRTVRAYNNDKYPYPKADLDKVSCVQKLKFEEYKVNQPISPSMYEQEHVFVPGAETWDYDRRVMIEQSLDEIAKQTVLQLNQFEDENIQQPGSCVATKTDNKHSDTVVKKIVTQESGVTKDVNVHGNDISLKAKQTNKLNWLWLAVAIGGIVVFVIVLCLKTKPLNRSTCSFLLIAFFLLLLNSNSRAENASSPGNISVNLGVMDIHTDSMVYEYDLMNPLKEPLKILKVKTTCSCTVAQFPGIIAPGETKPVRITVSSEKKLGKIDTSVAILTDKFPDPIMIYLTAYKQNATMTHNVMFTDVDVTGKLRNSKLQLTRAIVVDIFDNQTEDVGVENLVYDPNMFNITSYGSSAEKYQVEHNGVNWRHISKVFAVQIKPMGLGVGEFSKKICLQHLPILNIKSSEGENLIPPLFTTATGRVFDKLYTSPSSLTFLINNGKPLNKKKKFVVFSGDTLDYDISYDTDMFQITSKPSGQYELGLSKDCLEKIQNKKSLDEFVRFSYLDKNECRKEYKLPVKIVSY